MEGETDRKTWTEEVGTEIERQLEILTKTEEIELEILTEE